jgi:hypothetical protein
MGRSGLRLPDPASNGERGTADRARPDDGQPRYCDVVKGVAMYQSCPSGSRTPYSRWP